MTIFAFPLFADADARRWLLSLARRSAGGGAGRRQSPSCATARPRCCSATFRAPLIEAAGLNPENVDVVLVDDPEINAFVASGQMVYIHSGLITAADNVNELQGVIAHELGHVAGGHSIRFSEGARPGQQPVDRVLAARRRWRWPPAPATPAIGLIMAGQQAALSRFLAFSRTQESSADQAGANIFRPPGSAARAARLLRQAAEPGIPPRGLCQGQLRPHPPAFDERVAALKQVSRTMPPGTAARPGARGALPAGQGQAARLCRIPSRRRSNIPKPTSSVPAHYARAYAYHVGGYPEKRCRKPTPARARSARSLLPRAEGPDPARIRQAGGGDRAAARSDRPFAQFSR